MKSKNRVNPAGCDADLERLLSEARPVEALDLKGLAQAIEALHQDPDFIAESAKGLLIEDILRAMDESHITKSELARRMGKSRQQINVLLDEEKKNNFTIETMARISTALGQRLVVRLLPDTPEA
jgi:hypothetical protein